MSVTDESDDETYVREAVGDADPMRGQPVAALEDSPDELRRRAQRRAEVVQFRKRRLMVTFIVLLVVMAFGWLATWLAPMLSQR